MGDRSGVLVVDDDSAIRALVAKIIQRAGYSVDTARDGAEALDLLAAHPYAVLVLDLMMPNVDGYALLDRLKESGRPLPTVIVISADDTASLRELDGAIVHSIIRKPFDIDVLGELVAAAAASVDEIAAAASDNLLQFPESEQEESV